MLQLSQAQWQLGDWANESQWGLGPDIADLVGVSMTTLWIAAWVSRTFRADRRRPDLSYTHHLEVASLPDAVADDLLDAAVALHWTRSRLRTEAQAARRELDAEALRQENAEQRRLDLDPTAVAWHSDSRRIERECRERLIAVEAGVRSMLDAVQALAEHPGAGLTHGHRRRATVARLRSILAPMGDSGIDLTAQLAPLLDAIWAPEREDGR